MKKIPPSEHPDDRDALRAEIEASRRRMDATLHALGDRLRGRHLLDELLHLLRQNQGNGTMIKIKDSITHSADRALHGVLDTVKVHPVPVALIGAGVAWLIVEKTREHRQHAHPDDEFQDYQGLPPYADDFQPEPAPGSPVGAGSIDPLYKSSSGRGGIPETGIPPESGFQEPPESELDRHLSQGAREKASAMGGRLHDLGAAARERTRRMYERSRERVGTAVREHPLQSGLVCLALGFVAGLALTPPRRLRQSLEPKARELRERAREAAHDAMEKGKAVVHRAAEAAERELAGRKDTKPGAGAQPSGGPAASPTGSAGSSGAGGSAGAGSSSSPAKDSGASGNLPPPSAAGLPK